MKQGPPKHKYRDTKRQRSPTRSPTRPPTRSPTRSPTSRLPSRLIRRSKKDHIVDPNKTTLILVSARFCPHCKNIQKDWEESAKEAEEKGLVVKKVEVGDSFELSKEDKETISKLELDTGIEIDHFPTIILVKNMKAELYTGPITANDFIETLKN